MASTPSKSPKPVADTLLKTLQEEEELLDTLHQTFDRQLEALRNRQPDVLEDATLEANDHISRMSHLRQTRERQVRLLSKVLRMESADASLVDIADALQHAQAAGLSKALLEARASLREKAAQTQQRCEELETALNYAMHLGREMLEAIKGLDVPPPPQVYTARGQKEKTTTPRSLLNRLG